MNIDLEKMMSRYSRDQEFLEEVNDIPWLPYIEGLLIRAIGPFGGAAVRYQFRTLEKDTLMSVYFDTTNSCGHMDKPYFEIYSSVLMPEGPERFYGSQTEEMLNRIKELMIYS